MREEIQKQATQPLIIKSPGTDTALVRQKLAETEKAVAELKEAFRKYARHLRYCEIDSTGKCGCGYRDAVKLFLEE